MLIIAAAAAIAAVPVPMSDRGAVKSVAPVCQQVAAQKADKVDPALFQGPRSLDLVQGLNREPAADVYSAVLYTEGNCSKPIVVGRNMGMNPKGK